jgi:hypothetical protein
LLGHSGGFRLPNTLSSYKLANVINKRYHTIRMIPYFLSSFQPLRWVATTRKMTVESKERVEYVRPGGRKKNRISENLHTMRRTYLCVHPSINLHIPSLKIKKVLISFRKENVHNTFSSEFYLSPYTPNIFPTLQDI